MMDLSSILKKSAKPSHHGVWHQMLWRYLSLPITWLLLRLKATPNQVTVIAAIVKGISIILYFSMAWLPAALVYELGILFDCADGAIARITRKFSRRGSLLDSISDIIIYRVFFVILAISLFLAYRNVWMLLLALILFSVVTMRELVFVYGEKEIPHGNDPLKAMERMKSKFSVLARLLTITINFSRFVFPFIVLFPLQVILAFYLINILIEIIRLAFYLKTIFSVVKD